MKDYPRTLLEFEDRCQIEEACRAYLVQLRWPNGFHCRCCGQGQRWQTGRGGVRLSRLSGAQLGHCRDDLPGQPSAPAGVVPSDVVGDNQKSGMTALGLQRALGLGSYRTAWTCLQKLRRAMIRPGREQRGGEVEVDDIVVGGGEKGKGKRHLGETKALVAVAAEVRGSGIGRIRLQRIPDASGESLVGFVRETVAPGAVVITDGWTAYPGLVRHGYPQRPRIVSRSGQRASALLPRVHRVAALLKRWLLGIHHGAVSHEHLHAYLDEFTFRFNRRHSRHRGKLFYRLVQQVVMIEPVPYSILMTP